MAVQGQMVLETFGLTVRPEPGRRANTQDSLKDYQLRFHSKTLALCRIPRKVRGPVLFAEPFFLEPGQQLR